MQTFSGAENSHGVPSNHFNPGVGPPTPHAPTPFRRSLTSIPSASNPRRASPDRGCAPRPTAAASAASPPGNQPKSRQRRHNTKSSTLHEKRPRRGNDAAMVRSHGTRQEDKSGGATTYGTTRSRPRRARRVRVRGRTGRGGRGWYHRM